MSKNDPQKDDEEFWNSSEKHAFSFDQNNEVEIFIYLFIS